MYITEPLPGEKRARLVFGLDWRAYPLKGKKDGRARYAEDFTATHYVEMQVGDVMLGGFCAPDASDLKGVKLYSGAARVAMLERVRTRPAVLVLMQDGQRAHLVYVVRGAVNNDEVVSLAQAEKRRDEIAQQCRRQGLALVVLTSGEALAQGDEPFQTVELLALKKAGKLARVPVGVPNAVVFLLAAGVGIFAVKEAVSVFSPPALPANARPTWTQQYEKALRHEFVAGTPMASQLAPQLIETIVDFDSNREGWQFRDATCPRAGYCSLAYTRTGGTFEDFARRAPASMLPLTFDRSGLALGARGPAVPEVAAVVAAQSKAWPGEQQLIDMLQTPAQQLSTRPFDLKSFGYRVRLSPAQPLINTPPPANERHGPLIRAGTWEIDGYRWQAPLLARLPPDMTLETLKVTLDTEAPEEMGKVGIKFVAKGKYYVVQ
ncbi:hypothetical protein [Paraburkholderia mimosarum]|nr:hypothetical protein [Paraburkholderia mimosarum]